MSEYIRFSSMKEEGVNLEDLLSELNVILDHEPIVKLSKPVLSDDEIEAVAKEHLEFLNLLFPFMEYTPYRINYQDRRESLHVELRAMKRFDPGSSGKKGTARYTSFNTFNLNESCEEFLQRYIRQCNRAKNQLCEYFIFSAFDKNIAKNADTEPSKRPIMCTAENTAMTQSLMLDFDGISKEEFVEHYAKIRQQGLEFLTVFTGHGYQIHFLLDEPTRDVHSLKAFVRLAVCMGYPVDKSANTISQLARMPHTWNSKAYDPKYGYDLEVIQTEWLIKTDKRYSLDELFLKLSENQCNYDQSWDALSMNKPLPVNTADEEFRLAEQEKIKNKIKAKFYFENIKKEEKEKKKAEKKKEKEEKVEKRIEFLDKSSSKEAKKDMEVSFVAVDLEELYPMIKDVQLHSTGVQNVLKGPYKKCANVTLKFIVAYFKNIDYSLDEIIEIVNVWRKLNTFNYAWDDQVTVESETKRFYTKDYKVASSDIPTLQDIYGELFDKDGSFYSIKDQIIFDNKLFCSLKSIKTGPFFLYCVLKAECHRSDKEWYTAKELKDLALKNIDTVRNNMEALVKLGLVEKVSKKPTGKKGGRPTDYFKLTSKDIKEFTVIDAGKLDGLILRASHPIKAKRISERAFMVAIYIRFRCFGKRKSCYMRQARMAEEMGIDRTTLNQAMAELEKHNLIKKQVHEQFTTLEYIIMY